MKTEKVVKSDVSGVSDVSTKNKQDKMKSIREELFRLKLARYNNPVEKCDTCTKDSFWTRKWCQYKESIAELGNHEFKYRIENCPHYVSDSKYPERIHAEYLMFPKDSITKKLYLEIIDFLQENIEFQEPIHYLICASWVLLTWIPEIADRYPILHFGGLSGSGKTRAWDAISKICYNVITYTNPTPAVVFRTIKNRVYSEEVKDRKGKVVKKKELIAIEFNTMFIDEFLKINRFATPQEEEICRILNEGYKVGGVVPRCSSDNYDDIKDYDVTGFKCISCIQTLPYTLSDRCITIPMVKSNRRFNLRMDNDVIEQLREDLNCWRKVALNNFELINYIEQNTTEPIVFDFAEQESRILELYCPIYRFTPFKYKPYILKYVKQIAYEKKEEYYSSFDAEVFDALLTVYNPYVAWVPTDDVTKEYNKKHPIKPLDNRVIGRALKTMGFKNKKTNTQRGYELNPILLCKLAKRFGMEDRIEQQTKF
ncbi:MAG: hypothetical protein JW702_08970 [Clostridiales bacterium]|nr:hypothetical protein [Clostridiales bacterium]